MIQSSGFFSAASRIPEQPEQGLEQMYVSPEGHCILLKGYRNDRLVVYKALKPEFRSDPVFQRMLRREYEIGVSLKHPGVCETLAWTTLPEYGCCIEMEYIDGSRLDEWLKVHSGDRKLCRKVVCDLCDALSYIHRKQVIHKDLKPENILVTKYGSYPKIIDFGLSDTDSVLTGKDPAGTWKYAAPEVRAGKAADARSDIYSLGILMSEMGPSFSRIARKCSAERPELRYQSAEALLEDVVKGGRVSRQGMAAAVFLILAAVLCAGFFLWRSDPTEKLFLDAAEQVREASTLS